MKKRILILIMMLMLFVTITFAQTGSYTTNGYFYLPNYGAYGLTEYNEYNTYMQIADTQIQYNKDHLTDDDLSDDSINALSDVYSNLPADKQVLIYDGVADNRYENRQLTSDDLTDVDSIAMLDENETVTGNWVIQDSLNIKRDHDTLQAWLNLWHRRDGDPTYNVSDGDYLGSIFFRGNIPESDSVFAAIHGIVDSTTGIGDAPGRLEFLTTPDGSATPALRMAIDNAGNVKMGDGAWTNYVNIDNSGEMTFNGTASINEPTIYSRVTTKTTTATLTVAEAGTVLVSASSDYTITLPTAVGNKGLTYHFKKTDANYNCITLDGDGTETLNYENSTSAPVQTYARLNTYCAEATVVSDGSNWQVMDEKMGQVPMCKAYLDEDQTNITVSTWTKVLLDAVDLDIGNNFDEVNSKYIIPIPGKYEIFAYIKYFQILADKYFWVGIRKNGSELATSNTHSSTTNDVISSLYILASFSKDDYLESWAFQNGDSTAGIKGISVATNFYIKLISKD